MKTFSQLFNKIPSEIRFKIHGFYYSFYTLLVIFNISSILNLNLAIKIILTALYLISLFGFRKEYLALHQDADKRKYPFKWEIYLAPIEILLFFCDFS